MKHQNLISLVTNEPAKVLRSWITNNFSSPIRQAYGIQEGSRFSNRWSKPIMLGFLEKQTGSLELWNSQQDGSTSTPVAMQDGSTPATIVSITSDPHEQKVIKEATTQEEKKIASGLHKTLVPLKDKLSGYCVRKSDRLMMKLSQSRSFLNLLLIGNAGIGKTYAGEYLALKRGYPAITVSMSSDTSLKELMTRRELKDGNTLVVIGQILALIQLPSTIILDEIPMIPARFLAKLFELFAGNTIYIPELDRVIKRHPDCIIICTGNPSDPAYSGAERLNAAFVDRMIAFPIPDFTAKQIEQIAGVTDKEAAFFVSTRKTLISQKKKAVLSIRSMIDFRLNKDLLGTKVATDMLEAKLVAMDPTTGNMIHGSALQSLENVTSTSY